jgi:3-vinyl bacteriochlorophyllide hydratase
VSNLTKPLYTAEQRKRRNESVWTLIQGILAPVQFLIFIVSFCLVIRYLFTGDGYEIATVSIVIKTMALYLIMITGSIWEKVVFGKYLFAEGFFWEDVFSMLVLGLHTAYLYFLWNGSLSANELIYLALAAYVAYLINAAQFLWKLRVARYEGVADETVVEEERNDRKVSGGMAT